MAVTANRKRFSALGLVEKARNIHNLEQEKDGYKILKKLIPGFLRVLKKIKEGKMADTWCEEKVYHKLMSTMFRYMFILGKGRIIFNIINFLLSSFLFISIDIWTGCWSNNIFKSFKLRHYMMIYLGLSLTASFFVILRDLMFTRTIMKNSNEVHNKMLHAMLNMKLKFFNMFPTARVDFKLSYDIRRIDTVINRNFSNLIEAIAFVFGGMLILNYVYIGTMLIVTIILGIYLKYIVRKFVNTTTKIIQFIAENTSAMSNLYKVSINEMIRYRVLGKIDLIKKEFQTTTNEM